MGEATYHNVNVASNQARMAQESVDALAKKIHALEAKVERLAEILDIDLREVPRGKAIGEKNMAQKKQSQPKVKSPQRPAPRKGPPSSRTAALNSPTRGSGVKVR